MILAASGGTIYTYIHGRAERFRDHHVHSSPTIKRTKTRLLCMSPAPKFAAGSTTGACLWTVPRVPHPRKRNQRVAQSCSAEEGACSLQSPFMHATAVPHVCRPGLGR